MNEAPSSSHVAHILSVMLLAMGAKNSVDVLIGPQTEFARQTGSFLVLILVGLAGMLVVSRHRELLSQPRERWLPLRISGMGLLVSGALIPFGPRGWSLWAAMAVVMIGCLLLIVSADRYLTSRKGG